MTTEDPIDYLELKKEAEKLVEQLATSGQSPFIVCIGNKAYFNFK